MVVETLRHAPARTSAWANLGLAYVKGGANFEEFAVGAYLLAYRFSLNQQRTKEVFSGVLDNESDETYKRVMRRVMAVASPEIKSKPPMEYIPPMARLRNDRRSVGAETEDKEIETRGEYPQASP